MTSRNTTRAPFPLPRVDRGTVAIPAPGPGPQRWAGAPSAALDGDGQVILAYRVRGEADYNVLAHSPDGERFTTIGVFTKERFGAAMVERPALVRTDTGRWRMYVCCATPGTKHWWIGVLEAADPAGLVDAGVRPVFEGDSHTGVKDPVVRRTGGLWEAWICCHPLDEPGQEDRMTTAYATSADGLEWQWHGTVLRGRLGEWDARGARVTCVLPDGRVSYDGRATVDENWFERTGVATPGGSGSVLAADSESPVDVRYLDVVALPSGEHRLYYEARLPDESHELRTEVVPAGW
jgi:hypothetical protein